MKLRLYSLLILAITIPLTADYYKLMPKHKKPTQTQVYLLGGKIDLKNTEIKEVADAIEKYSASYNIDKRIIIGLIKTESNWDRYAISDKGAIGLTQVMYKQNPGLRTKTKRHPNGVIQKKSDLFDIDRNIEAGVFILHEQLIKENNRIVSALWNYNNRDRDPHKFPNAVLSYAFNVKLKGPYEGE
jgi:soluble lytic murein transglycosylase-like protein